jgi:carbamoyl-phosphate synthase large subunit
VPRRSDIETIMLIGSGPIVIGQACEFDYSGTQACKALREEGYRIVLVNSNPATIMTDPEVADRTYIEPITPEVVEKIIARERPQALLPTLGGQTALNTAVAVAQRGTLEKYGVELIGADVDVINRAEERDLFKAAMVEADVPCLKSRHVHSVEQAVAATEEIGLPVIIRPSFTLGGTGGGIAHTLDELRAIAEGGLKASMTTEVLIEESVIGWKEFELEVMRDRNDNVVIICSIENLDPMGIHTGDSITVAPAQTLTDREYQHMRDATIRVMKAIGVETGGSNVQFAMNPVNGQMVVIEMNPRVSRSSALASKATGFPIAKIAAKLAVGYTLDELPNDITRETPASFEPSIDYCVVKVPRFAFEKFPGADNALGVSMKSVGETMAIGRNFKEALQKAFRGLEIGVDGLDRKAEALAASDQSIEKALEGRNATRIFCVRKALREGVPVKRIYDITGIDPWFVDNIAQIVELEGEIVTAYREKRFDRNMLVRAKEFGFSDAQLSELSERGSSEHEVRAERLAAGVKPVYHLVDTCAGEFEAHTPYYYSCYGQRNEATPSKREKIMILSSGPNRIGQGIEFDYCCVHTVQTVRELGYEAIMVNSNPETVSTDYDTSDRLYFEPLTFEDVMNIHENERPKGVIVQMGGQTPLNLAVPLMQAGVRILGTSPDSIDRAEDRKRCRELLNDLQLRQPESDTATTLEEARRAADLIGYPVMVRPSYVLGGRAMMIAHNQEELEPFTREAFKVSAGFPVLIDRYLTGAIEVDVDSICDGKDVYIGGVMQHVEAAGVHSGDSACATPPHTLEPEMQRQLEEACKKIALALDVRGLMNVQLAVVGEEFYIIEINPRASRTVPYLSKATGVPLARVAAKICVGITLEELGLAGHRASPAWCAVKEAVFPFDRFAGVDPILGPEMKSTGEVMGIGTSFEAAYWKSQIAAGQVLPEKGSVFLSAKDSDKPWIVELGIEFEQMGFEIIATNGTSEALRDAGVLSKVVNKVADNNPPTIIDYMRDNKVHLLVNTRSGPVSRLDETFMRSEAILRSIPIVTTEPGARATVASIRYIQKNNWDVRALQDYLKELEPAQ